ncbi:MAG: hypothetical protein ACJAZS_000043 [Alteromonas naphthalenivorans]|jgi:hypothetical protein
MMKKLILGIALLLVANKMPAPHGPVYQSPAERAYLKAHPSKPYVNPYSNFTHVSIGMKCNKIEQSSGKSYASYPCSKNTCNAACKKIGKTWTSGMQDQTTKGKVKGRTCACADVTKPNPIGIKTKADAIDPIDTSVEIPNPDTILETLLQQTKGTQCVKGSYKKTCYNCSCTKSHITCMCQNQEDQPLIKTTHKRNDVGTGLANINGSLMNPTEFAAYKQAHPTYAVARKALHKNLIWKAYQNALEVSKSLKALMKGTKAWKRYNQAQPKNITSTHAVYGEYQTDRLTEMPEREQYHLTGAKMTIQQDNKYPAKPKVTGAKMTIQKDNK